MFTILAITDNNQAQVFYEKDKTIAERIYRYLLSCKDIVTLHFSYEK